MSKIILICTPQIPNITAGSMFSTLLIIKWIYRKTMIICYFRWSKIEKRRLRKQFAQSPFIWYNNRCRSNPVPFIIKGSMRGYYYLLHSTMLHICDTDRESEPVSSISSSHIQPDAFSSVVCFRLNEGLHVAYQGNIHLYLLLHLSEMELIVNNNSVFQS